MSQLHETGLLMQHCYINGQWLDAAERLPVFNPATGQQIASVPRMGVTETRQAIAAAERPCRLAGLNRQAAGAVSAALV
jgi:succinate-semialdehyde dehydrogenase/glutarate-semialdehyde dehydrogenase